MAENSRSHWFLRILDDSKGPTMERTVSGARNDGNFHEIWWGSNFMLLETLEWTQSFSWNSIFKYISPRIQEEWGPQKEVEVLFQSDIFLNAVVNPLPSKTTDCLQEILMADRKYRKKRMEVRSSSGLEFVELVIFLQLVPMFFYHHFPPPPFGRIFLFRNFFPFASWLGNPRVLGKPAGHGVTGAKPGGTEILRAILLRGKKKSTSSPVFKRLVTRDPRHRSTGSHPQFEQCNIYLLRCFLGGGNSNIFYFHLYLGMMNPFWRAYSSDGLVQPPTSF